MARAGALGRRMRRRAVAADGSSRRPEARKNALKCITKTLISNSESWDALILPRGTRSSHFRLTRDSGSRARALRCEHTVWLLRGLFASICLSRHFESDPCVTVSIYCKGLSTLVCFGVQVACTGGLQT